MKERIQPDWLQVGDTVPCDIFTVQGRLLLSRGHVVATEQQRERLVNSGLFDPAALDEHGFARAPRAGRTMHEFAKLPSQMDRERVSIFDRMADVTARLDALMSAGPSGPRFAEGIMAAAVGVRQCCALDSDAALARILLSDRLRYTLRHPTNVAVLAAILMSRLHHDDKRACSATAAALTMNLSIVDLQEALVRQKEGLREEQRAALRRHPTDSERMLRERGVEDPVWLQTVAQHHEARDGTGFPAGARDDAICREAQIVSLADRYCALVSARDYRPAIAPRRAIKELHDRAGKAIESALIGTLISAIGIFPPGAYVRLSNGETAVVVRRLLDPKHPAVYALHQDTTAPYDPPRKRLTAAHKDYEIIADVRPEAVRSIIDTDMLWPPSATGEPAAPSS
jgi:HD-GYP domain-containing protein (c-di-GMP phosphodiesterase class II)